VFTVLVVSVVVALVFATYVFRRYLRYVPHVAEHMPADYAVALRLDVEHEATFEPFRRHLLPLLDADRPPGSHGLPPRLDTLRSATTIELDVDLREIGVVVDARGRWLVLLGGHFRRAGVARDLAALLEREGSRVQLETGPERLVLGSGAALGVCSDGVIALAADDELLLGVLDAKPRGVQFRAGTALSLAVGNGEDSPIAGLAVDVWPGEDFPIELRLPRTGDEHSAKSVAPLLSGNTGDFKLFAGTGPWHIAGAPGGALRASAVLSAAEFDAAVAELAGSLRTLLGLLPAEPPGG
jgi:hypothetical protein